MHAATSISYQCWDACMPGTKPCSFWWCSAALACPRVCSSGAYESEVLSCCRLVYSAEQHMMSARWTHGSRTSSAVNVQCSALEHESMQMPHPITAVSNSCRGLRSAKVWRREHA